MIHFYTIYIMNRPTIQTFKTLCLLGNFAFFFVVFCFFQKQHFQKIISEIPSEYQIVWIQIRPNILWGPGLCSNSLQKLSADDTCRQRVKGQIMALAGDKLASSTFIFRVNYA